MRRLILALSVLGVVSAGLLVARDASAAAAPVVNSIVEGREGGSGKEVLVIVGNNLTAVSTYNLTDTGGALVGQLFVKLKTKNLLVLGLPEGIASGKYQMHLYYGKGGTSQVQAQVSVTNLAVGPGGVLPGSLDAALRTDLDDASQLGGHDPSYFLDAANLQGILDPSRYSAYADLLVESRVGTASTQVAAGDHLHDGRYVQRAGDTVTAANFSFSATSGTPIAATTSAAAGYGLSGTNSASGGVGISGAATNSGGAASGVVGTTAAASGYGIKGDNQAGSGSGVGVWGVSASGDGTGVLGTAPNTVGTAAGVAGTSDAGQGFGVLGTATSSNGVGVKGTASSASGSSIGVHGYANSASGVGVFAQSQGTGLSAVGQTQGAVIASVGTTGTGLTVQTSGNNLAIFQTVSAGVPTNKARIDTSGKGWFNGGTATSGADFAESVVTQRPANEYEPGDVMVIDVTGTRRFARSAAANSTLVSGVYATKPGVLARPGDVAGDLKWTETEVPMAIVGIVPCKVCDEGGAIEPGDLLVTSSTPGHAMKAPANPAAGTLLGKALGRLDGKSGKVEILLLAR